MQITKQQQILGYFIEEAKEHLDSIEHGLLNLKDTMDDAEEMNQMFRAAHSIKGGAAMLGFNSIQKVSHHLEDYFKLLKDNPVNIDHKLEDLFLKGFDALKALVDQLQGTFGLRDEDAEQIVKSTEPIFAELGNYLNCLIQGGVAPAPAAVKAAPPAVPTAAPVADGAAEQVTKILKVMLQLFKQGDNAKSRQQLAALCTRLAQLSPKSQPWVMLAQITQKAIINPKAAYTVLAPLVIKELKQGSDLLLAGRASEILPSKSLQQLVTRSAAAPVPPVPAAQPVNAAKPLVSVAPVPAVEVTPAALPEATMMTSIRPRTIAVPAEPRAAARALLEAFNKNELIQLAEFLMKAIS